MTNRIFSRISNETFKALWRWACRRRPNKGLRRIKARYWKTEGNKKRPKPVRVHKTLTYMRLEPHEGKLSRTVLGGGKGGIARPTQPTTPYPCSVCRQPKQLAAEDMTKKKPKKATGKKKYFLFFLNFGKVIIDTAKLCFASLVLGNIIRGDFSQETLLNAGIIVTGAGTVFGLLLRGQLV